jgi:hypothetical protein
MRKTMKTQNEVAITEIAPFGIECGNFIDHIEDKSDETTKRIRVTFKNGLGLSVIQGEFSYGGDTGLYEIAPVNEEGGLDGSYFDDEDFGDDVCGYCDIKKVNHYINKLGNMQVM